MCADAGARAAFADALVDATRSPRVRVVVALRDDFLYRADELAPWRGVLARSAHVLHMPDVADLERIVATPARRLGFELDEPALAGEIVGEVADRPGALPILAFAAAQLWDRRDRRFRRLLRSAYVSIGGVTGALVRHADGVVDRMSPGDRKLAPRVPSRPHRGGHPRADRSRRARERARPVGRAWSTAPRCAADRHARRRLASRSSTRRSRRPGRASPSGAARTMPARGSPNSSPRPRAPGTSGVARPACCGAATRSRISRAGRPPAITA